jgi:site-specific DNA recombinase
VLLSFAQFEREVTAERIRDKIAASKKKGLWMGGRPVFGYEADGRTLKINPEEAIDVRWMFARYLELKSVNRLIDELTVRGVTSKRWINKLGEAKGGLPIERGAAYHMLRNPIYVGEIPHKDLVYPGQHPALIDRETFDAVQRLLDESRHRRKPGMARPPHTGAPLTGLIHDSAGHVMSPVSAARKGGATYRYYVSTAIQTGRRREAGVHARVSAPTVEAAVMTAMRPLFPQTAELDWSVVRDVIERVDVERDVMHIRLCQARCAERITSESGRLVLQHLDRDADQPILHIQIFAGRRGAITMAGPGGGHPVHAPRLDPALSAALVRAEAWKRNLYTGKTGSLADIAAEEGVTVRYAARILRVAYLAPDLKRAILDGKQSERLTLQSLVRHGVSLDWAEQRARHA